MSQPAVANRALTETRDAAGRFMHGNPGGPGNPHAGKVRALRDVFFDAVTPEEFRKVVEACLRSAQLGDVRAQGKILAYAIGKEEAADISDKLDQLRESLRAARHPLTPVPRSAAS